MQLYRTGALFIIASLILLADVVPARASSDKQQLVLISTFKRRSPNLQPQLTHVLEESLGENLTIIPFKTVKKASRAIKISRQNMHKVENLRRVSDGLGLTHALVFAVVRRTKKERASGELPWKTRASLLRIEDDVSLWSETFDLPRKKLSSESLASVVEEVASVLAPASDAAAAESAPSVEEETPEVAEADSEKESETTSEAAPTEEGGEATSEAAPSEEGGEATSEAAPSEEATEATSEAAPTEEAAEATSEAVPIEEVAEAPSDEAAASDAEAAPSDEAAAPEAAVAPTSTAPSTTPGTVTVTERVGGAPLPEQLEPTPEVRVDASESSQKRPLFVAMGIRGLQRNGKISSTMTDGVLKYKTKGVVPGALLQGRVYLFEYLDFSVDWLRQIELSADVSVFAIKSSENDADLGTNMTSDSTVALTYHHPLRILSDGPDLRLSLGYNYFRLPLGEASFPGTRYHSNFLALGLAYPLPFSHPVTFTADVGYNFSLIPSGKLKRLGKDAKSGNGFKAQVVLETTVNDMVLSALWSHQTYNSDYKGETTLPRPTQFQSASLEDTFQYFGFLAGYHFDGL